MHPKIPSFQIVLSFFFEVFPYELFVRNPMRLLNVNPLVIQPVSTDHSDRPVLNVAKIIQQIHVFLFLNVAQIAREIILIIPKNVPNTHLIEM